MFVVLQAVGCQDGSIACYNIVFSTVHGLYKDRSTCMYIINVQCIYTMLCEYAYMREGVLHPADAGQQARNSCTGLHIFFSGVTHTFCYHMHVHVLSLVLVTYVHTCTCHESVYVQLYYYYLDGQIHFIRTSVHVRTRVHVQVCLQGSHD